VATRALIAGLVSPEPGDGVEATRPAVHGPVLVTGSEGLIGRPLCARLRELGIEVRELDRRGIGRAKGDVCDTATLCERLAGVRGVVHLAAISRVVEAQSCPDACLATNYRASRVLARLAPDRGARWMLFASSREVYGVVSSGRVAEDSPLDPMNVYGRSKAMAEEAVQAASGRDFCGAVVRFSNVFGGVNDHATRVVPLFLAEAARSGVLRVEGGDRVFDFTFVDDVVEALTRLVLRLEAGARPPPIHLVTGRGVSLWQLATAAIAATGGGATAVEAPARDYDMARFVGDPARAADLLGWRHTPDAITSLLARFHARLRSASLVRRPAGRVGTAWS
jgi:nucleoside-diphosphate-sugar epimerase